MSGKAPFHCKVHVDFVDNAELINFSGWFGAIHTYFCVFQNFSVTWYLKFIISYVYDVFICHRNFEILFSLEFPFTTILCLIETSQLILTCEIEFTLPDFWLAEFSDHIKMICLLFSTMDRRFQKIFAVIPTKKLIFLN